MFGSSAFQQKNISTSAPRKGSRRVAEPWVFAGDIDGGGSCCFVQGAAAAYPAGARHGGKWSWRRQRRKQAVGPPSQVQELEGLRRQLQGLRRVERQVSELDRRWGSEGWLTAEGGGAWVFRGRAGQEQVFGPLRCGGVRKTHTTLSLFHMCLACLCHVRLFVLWLGVISVTMLSMWSCIVSFETHLCAPLNDASHCSIGKQFHFWQFHVHCWRVLIFLLPRTISRAAARSPPRLLSCASCLYSTFDPAFLQQRVCMSAQLRSEPTQPTQHSKTCHHHQDCGFASRIVFITQNGDTNAQGLLIRTPEALRLLTMCNFDGKIISLLFVCGLRKYSTECIHPSQRCVTQRIMTDNIFEIETAAIALRTCYAEDSEILLTDFSRPGCCENVVAMAPPCHKSLDSFLPVLSACISTRSTSLLVCQCFEREHIDESVNGSKTRKYRIHMLNYINRVYQDMSRARPDSCFVRCADTKPCEPTDLHTLRFKSSISRCHRRGNGATS